MAQGPAEALKTLPLVFSVDSPPTRARDVIVRICLHLKWYTNASDAFDYSEKIERAFLKRVQEDIVYWESRGRALRYAINSSSPYLIQGAAFIEATDSEPVRVCSKSRGFRPKSPGNQGFFRTFGTDSKWLGKDVVSEG